MAMARAKRFSHYAGDGCWPERSAVYDAQCCGKSDSMPTEFMNEFKKFHKDLDETSAWLKTYTADSLFAPTNKALKSNDPSYLPKVGGYVYKVKRAIKDRYKSVGRTRGLLYRGAGVPKEHLYLFTLTGRRFLMPCFWSTTKKRSTAQSFLCSAVDGKPDRVGVLFIIDTDREVGMSYFVDVADISAYQNEQETLFFPYTGFEITAVGKEDGRQVVYLKPYDQKLYLECAIQRVEWCRFAFNEGDKRIPLAQCFYLAGGVTKSAMSCARVSQFATGTTQWAKRSTPKDLGTWVESMWKHGTSLNTVWVGSGADGTWSAFAHSAFGTQQSYKWGKDIDEILKWTTTHWKEGKKITSWAVQDGQHFIVMTKDASMGGLSYAGEQKWKLCSGWTQFSEYRTDAWENGYCLTSLCFDRSTTSYIAVMTKAPNGQGIKCGSEFPTDWVQEQWGQGKTITQVCYDTVESAPWCVVTTSGIGDCNKWSTELRT